MWRHPGSGVAVLSDLDPFVLRYMLTCTGQHARKPVRGVPRAAPARARNGAVGDRRAAACAAAAQQRHLEPAVQLVT